MKYYTATEARAVAKTAHLKTYKKEINDFIAAIMYLIEETAKEGKYSLECPLEEATPELRNTFNVLLKELGYKTLYNLNKNEDKITIYWD